MESESDRACLSNHLSNLIGITIRKNPEFTSRYLGTPNHAFSQTVICENKKSTQILSVILDDMCLFITTIDLTCFIFYDQN